MTLFLLRAENKSKPVHLVRSARERRVGEVGVGAECQRLGRDVADDECGAARRQLRGAVPGVVLVKHAAAD